MTWSNLETDFQEGEATQALITRDDGDDVDDTIHSEPRVLTSGCGDALALVIDNNLHVFGAKGKETQFSVQLKTPVVALGWVQIPPINDCSASFLFCATSDGQLFVYTDRIKKLLPFHSLTNLMQLDVGDGDKENSNPPVVGSRGEEEKSAAAEEIHSLRFVAPSSCPPAEATDERGDSAHRLVVITTKCRCFVLANLLLVDIFKAILGANMTQVVKLKNQVRVSEEILSNQGWTVRDVAYSAKRRSMLVSTSHRDDNQCLLLRFPKNRPHSILTENIQTAFPVRRLKWSRSGKYFFALEECENGGSRLLRYCSLTRVALDVILDSPQLIKDFLLLNEDDPASAAQLAAVHPPSSVKQSGEDRSGNCNIEIRVFPDMTSTSSSSASWFTHVVRQDEAKDLVFVEAVKRDVDASGVEELVPISDYSSLDALRICNLSSLRPENFLHSLLRKNKYEAALAWAMEKGLDAQIVHEKEALHNLRKSVAAEREKGSAAIFEDLKKWCANVDDPSNVARYCFGLPYESEELTTKVLQHLLRRLEKRKDADVQLRRDLEATLRRLFSFIFAMGKETKIIPWKDFVRTVNLFKGVMVPLIKNCSFDVVSRLWPSLVTELEISLIQQPSIVDDLVFSIPQTSQEFPSLCAWLREDFLPFLGAKIPSSLTNVCSWLLERAEGMEFFDSSRWPSGAIQLLQCAVDSKSSVRRYFPDDCGHVLAVVDQALAGVKSLLDDLLEIQLLRTKYSMNLNYHDYATTKSTENRTVTLACMMLRRIPSASLIPIALKKGAVANFLRDKNLNQDAVFMEYLKELSFEDKSFIDAEACEERATIILSLVENVGVKISALISALQFASLPWKPVIASMVEECLKLDHPLVESLRKNIAVVRLRDRLEPYGLDRRVEAAMKNEEKTIKWILSRDTPTSLADARFVAETAPRGGRGGVSAARVVLLHVHHLVRGGNVGGVGDVLSRLWKNDETALALEIAEKLVFRSVLNGVKASEASIDDEKYVAWKLNHVDVALEATQFLKSHGAVLDRKRFADLYASLSKLGWILRTGRDAALEECEATSGRYLFRRFVAEEVAKDAVDVAFVKKLASSLGLLEIESSLLLAQAVLEKSGPSSSVPYIVRATEELEAGPLVIPSHLFEEDDSAASIFKLARIFVAELRCRTTNDETTPSETQNLLSHLIRLMQLFCLRAPADKLASLEEWHARLRLIVDCLDHMTCVDSSFSLSRDDAVSKEEEDAVASALFPDVAKHLGQPVGFSVEAADLLPDLLNYFDVSANELEFAFVKKTVDALCSASLSHLAIRFLFDVKSLLEKPCSLSPSADGDAANLPGAIVENQSAIFDSYRNRIFRDYVKSLVSSGCVDNLDALTTLLEMPKDLSEKLLLDLAQVAIKSQSYKRLGVIAVLSEDVSHVERNPGNTRRAEKLGVDASWGYRLAKIGVKEFKDCVYKDHYKKIKLLEELIQSNDKLTSKIILDFCEDYLTNDSPDFHLLKFLTRVIDDYHRSSAEEARADFSAFVARAKDVAALIKDKRNLYNWASDQILQAFPYDYPLLVFLYTTARVAAEPCVGLDKEIVKLTKRAKVLDLLKDYVRTGEPTQEELSLMSTAGNTTSATADMIRRRLPFQSLFERESLEEILNRELTAATHALWITLSAQFGYPPDVITKAAINNEVQRYVGGSSFYSAGTATSADSRAGGGVVVASWTKSLAPADVDFIKRIESLVSKLSSESIVSVLEEDVLTKIADGSLKVAILGYVMRRFSQAMGDKVTKSARERRSVIKEESWANQYRRLATIEVLHVRGIVVEELVAHADEPEVLVSAIFRIYGAKAQTKGSDEIRDCVLEIMKIWDLKEDALDRWKDALIEEWIPSVSVSACDLDQTVSTSMIVHQRKANEEEEDEENLNRAVFILSPDEDSSVCRRLHRIYISGDMTHRCLSRVIACLLALVTDSQKLQEYFGFSRDEILKRLASHQHLTVLDQLNFKSTVEKFDSKDKQLMAQMLVQKYKHDERAIKLSRNLCVEYGIGNVSVWKDLLKQMISSASRDSELLEATFHCLIHDSALVKVFESPELKPMRESLLQILVLRPMAEFSPPLSTDETKQFVSLLRTVRSYPLAHEIDVDEMMRRCLRGGFAVGAFVLASLFIPDSAEKARKIDNLRQKHPGMNESLRDFEAELSDLGLHLTMRS